MVYDVKKLLILPMLVMAFQMDVVLSRGEAQAAQKIAVLDLRVIWRNSLAGKSIADQLNVYRKAFQKKADAQTKKLKTSENELRLQRSLLSPEAMKARERKFKDEVAAVQRQLQARRKALDKSRAEAFKIFEKNFTEVLKKLRAEKKIDIIIKKRPSIIYMEPSVNITGEVLKRLDVRIKKITVKNPGK
jgi:Skp family chaperone for outer membrane proteins